MEKQIIAAGFVHSWECLSIYTQGINFNHGFGIPPDADIHWDGNQLMLIVCEIAEAHEAIRKDMMDKHLPNRKGVEVELADAVIRIMNYAKERGLDVAGAIIDKTEYNDKRPYKHGGKKF